MLYGFLKRALAPVPSTVPEIAATPAKVVTEPEDVIFRTR